MFVIPFGTRESALKHRFPIITALLVLANVAVFLYELHLAVNFGDAHLAAFINELGVIPARFVQGLVFEPDLLTSMFLHGGFLHIAANMIYLMPFGDNVEESLGRFRYLFFYIACGIGASLTHIAFNPASAVPAIGASGAVAGVLAAYLVLHPRGVVRGLFFLWIFITTIEIPALVFILFWFITQLFSGLASLGVATAQTGGVAFWAHIGGFITGLILAPLLQLGKRRTSEEF
jgi:membrane associated rhomboid family serine protease